MKNIYKSLSVAQLVKEGKLKIFSMYDSPCGLRRHSTNPPTLDTRYKEMLENETSSVYDFSMLHKSYENYGYIFLRGWQMFIGHLQKKYYVSTSSGIYSISAFDKQQVRDICKDRCYGRVIDITERGSK